MRSTSKPTQQRSRKKQPLEIGWREWVSFPDYGIGSIKAKIDTGAKTSAIHAFRIREVDYEGARHVEFFLHPEQKRRNPEIRCIAPVLDQRLIKSSNGTVQNRFIVSTTLAIADREWSIDLSLTNRDDMGFRLLIGRDALRNKVIIHPAKSFMLGRRKRE